jgi:hypothetical protein
LNTSSFFFPFSSHLKTPTDVLGDSSPTLLAWPENLSSVDLGRPTWRQVDMCTRRNLFQMPEDLVLLRDVKENYENKCPIHTLGK